MFMASVTRKDEKPMAEGDLPEAEDEQSERDEDERNERAEKPQSNRGPAPAPRAEKSDSTGGGFFTLYKSGQGYWTRLGTAVGAAIILLFVGWFTWQQVNYWEIGYRSGRPNHGLTWGIVSGIAVVVAIIAWMLMNKPANVDFLIATDSEMKKVNWTSRRELIGSTKVVIAFMFIIAAFLFIMDVFFGYLFYFIKVLKTPPL
jgi:preprotein translocase subunit SecE